MNGTEPIAVPPVHRRKLGREDLIALAFVTSRRGERFSLENQHRLDGWVEKLVAFVGQNRNRIGKVIEQRFGDGQAHFIRDLLIDQAWPEYKDALWQPDLRALNAALWLERAAKPHPRTSEILEQLQERIANRTASWRPDAAAVPKLHTFEEVDSPLVQTGKTTAVDNKTIVLCSNHRSANTLATLHQLRSLGIRVDHIFVRPLVSISRLKAEIGFSPGFLAKRVINEMIMPRLPFKSGSIDHANLNSFKESIGCHWDNVKQAANDLNAKVQYFTNFNDARCVRELRSLKPDYGVFTGGGILSAEMLNTFRTGIIHAHPGILPQYKGMDVAPWAILEGNLEHLGSTCQLMSPKLDSGTLLSNSLINVQHYDSLQAVRTAIVSDKISLVCNTLKELISGRLKLKPDHLAGGSLYYLMHPKLTEVSCSIFEH